MSQTTVGPIRKAALLGMKRFSCYICSPFFLVPLLAVLDFVMDDKVELSSVGVIVPESFPYFSGLIHANAIDF